MAAPPRDDIMATWLGAGGGRGLGLAQSLLPSVRGGGRKQVVSITSRMGSIDDNSSGGYYGYRASKSALNMMNKSLSLELKPEGFTCIVMHPGWVATDMGGSSAP